MPNKRHKKYHGDLPVSDPTFVNRWILTSKRVATYKLRLAPLSTCDPPVRSSGPDEEERQDKVQAGSLDAPPAKRSRYESAASSSHLPLTPTTAVPSRKRGLHDGTYPATKRVCPNSSTAKRKAPASVKTRARNRRSRHKHKATCRIKQLVLKVMERIRAARKNLLSLSEFVHPFVRPVVSCNLDCSSLHAEPFVEYLCSDRDTDPRDPG